MLTEQCSKLCLHPHRVYRKSMSGMTLHAFGCVIWLADTSCHLSNAPPMLAHASFDSRGLVKIGSEGPSLHDQAGTGFYLLQMHTLFILVFRLQVVAVDCNPAQSALLELKATAIRYYM